jgi:Rrf2 family protein
MFSTTSEYALRALTVLATVPRGTAMLGRDLSRHTGVPASYLTKIMLAMRNAGLIGAARGNTGGYWLGRSADSIHLIDVVQVFEGIELRRRCLLWPGRECSEAEPCSAHRAWKGLRTEYLKFLENVTLADISEKTPPSMALDEGSMRQ